MNIREFNSKDLLAELVRLNSEIYPTQDVHNVISILNHNLSDLRMAVSESDKWVSRYNPSSISIKLRKKFEKRIKFLNYNDGIQMSFIANIDNQGEEISELSKRKIFVKTYEGTDFAYFDMKDFVRVKRFQDKIRIIESAMKRMKVSYDVKRFRKDNVNCIRIECVDVRDNEKFWYVLNLITKG